MTAKRSGLGKGLGKGLDSLIPDNRSTKKSTPLKEKVEEPVLAGEKMVKINMIEPNREQPRRNFEKIRFWNCLNQSNSLEFCSHCLYRKKGITMRLLPGNAGGELPRWPE